MECRPFLQRSELLLLGTPGQALSRRHVVRLLPRWTESGESAGRSRKSQVGESQLQCWLPVPLDGSHFLLGGRSDELCVSALSHISTGNARHVVHFDGQHQQSADDERGVSLAAASAPGQAMGTGDAQRWRPEQPAVQPLCQRWPAGAVLSGARHRLDSPRPEGRRRFSRRTRRAQPRLYQYRHLQRRVAAPFQRARRR